MRHSTIRLASRFSVLPCLTVAALALLATSSSAQEIRLKLLRPSAAELKSLQAAQLAFDADHPQTPQFPSSPAEALPTPEPETAQAETSTTRAIRARQLRLAQASLPAAGLPSAGVGPGSAPEAQPGSADDSLPVPPAGRRPIAFHVDTRFGFDNDKVIVSNPFPFEVDVKRRIRALVLSADYSLSDLTRISLSIPYIDQSVTSSSIAGNFRQHGRGIGDTSLWIERRFPNYNRGHEFSLAAGMLFPTGKDPFHLGPDELETGLGFYQPLFRASWRTLSVPLQFYGAVDYSTSFSRKVNGNTVKLPASYDGEVGILYSLGPEWTTQTSVSLGKVSSPFILGSGSSVGYLSQALNYRTGDRTSFRGSVDVGLTDDSTDVYAGLSLNSSF